MIIGILKMKLMCFVPLFSPAFYIPHFLDSHSILCSIWDASRAKATVYVSGEIQTLKYVAMIQKLFCFYYALWWAWTD